MSLNKNNANHPGTAVLLFRIYRPGQAFHLPADCNGLFSMARNGLSTVIYNINTNIMAAKTNLSTPTLPNSRSLFRSALILAGVVIAIVASKFLMQQSETETGFSILPVSKVMVSQLPELNLPGVEKIITGIVSRFN